MDTDTLVDSKRCSKCRLIKPVSEFHRCSKFKDGLAYNCKQCAIAASRESWARNGAEVLRRGRAARAAKRLAKDAEWEEYLRRGEKTCPRCRVSKAFEAFYINNATKDGRDTKCIECAKAYKHAHRTEAARRMKEWRQQHPERAREVWRRARLKSRDKHLASTRSWRERNKDRIKQYQAQYDDKRRDEHNAEKRAWYAANADAIRERKKEWLKNNRDYIRKARYARRARKYKAPGKHATAECAALLEKQNHLCANPYCKVDLRTTKKCLDHIVSLATNGCNCISNMQWLCIPCNSRKSTLPLHEWLAREAIRAERRNAA